MSLDRSEDCYDWNAFRRTEIGRVGDCTRKGMGPGEAGMTNSIWNMGYKCKSVASHYRKYSILLLYALLLCTRCEENLCVTANPDCSTEADCEALGGEWTNCTHVDRNTSSSVQESAVIMTCS